MVENLPNANYTRYSIQIMHTRHEGVCASPVAGPPPQSASLVRLCAPQEFIQVFWTATREGEPPVVPSYKSYLTNPNKIFLGGARTALEEPIFGAHSFSVSGVFVFALSAPEGLDSDFPISLSPWEAALGANVRDFMIPASYFQKGILNPALPGYTGLPANGDVLILESGISP